MPHQPLRDLDRVLRIEHRCRSLYSFERVRSVRVFCDRLNGGCASGNRGRTSVRGSVLNYFDPLLYARCAGKKIYGFYY